jgi:hypothetical protein
MQLNNDGQVSFDGYGEHSVTRLAHFISAVGDALTDIEFVGLLSL